MFTSIYRRAHDTGRSLDRSQEYRESRRDDQPREVESKRSDGRGQRDRGEDRKEREYGYSVKGDGEMARDKQRDRLVYLFSICPFVISNASRKNGVKTF